MNEYINKIFWEDCVTGMKEYIPDNSIHLTFTSPPYYNAKEYTQYESYDEYLHLITLVAEQVHRVLQDGRFFVINTSPVIEARSKRQDQSTRHGIPFDIHPIIIKAGFLFIDDIIWVKPEPSVPNRNAGFFRSRKPLAYKPNSVTEYVMVYRKKTDRLIDWNIGKYNEGTIKDSLVRGNYERSNVWLINPETSEEHPAVFPEGLAEKVIKYYSFKGDVVLDPFIGSGTTAVSCKKLFRKYVGFESSEHFCQIARKRVKQKKVFTTIDSFVDD